jgi:transposase
VTEQLDALRAMGTAPVDYLAVPRFVALVVALLAAFRHPRLCPFYYRPVAAGKPPKVALVAVMRKLIILLNCVLQDPTFQPA